MKTMTCSICGRDAPCVISKATGEPWCGACKQRRARCAGCGRSGPVRGGTLAEPLCAACTRPDPALLAQLPGLRASPAASTRPVRPLHAASSGCVTCSATTPARSARSCRPSTMPWPSTNGPAPCCLAGQEHRPVDPA